MNGDGKKVVNILKSFSCPGRNAKHSALLRCLAICARCHDNVTKDAAYKAFPEICRIPTHVFEFIKYCEEESAGSGWGRQHRKAIAEWYNNMDSLNLARLVTKYRERFSWTHRDVFRLCHIKPINEQITLIVVFIIKGIIEARTLVNENSSEDSKKILSYLEAVEQTKTIQGIKNKQALSDICELIKKYKLNHEQISNHVLKLKEIWVTLLEHMPMNAMIRNLGQMTSKGVIEPGSIAESIVISKLNDKQLLYNARMHPIKILVAWKTYDEGKGFKSSHTWSKNEKISETLEEAFYNSFHAVEPTNQRFLLAIDVSGSMDDRLPTTPALSARDAAGAMAMVTARREKNYEIIPFSDTPPTPLNIHIGDKLADILAKCKKCHSGSTDCALPMIYALEHKKEFDVFIIYTDSDTNYGTIHPFDALKKYRKEMNIPEAKLVVIGMKSNGFTIADPMDKFMLDVVGFDPNAPEIINNFVRGDIDITPDGQEEKVNDYEYDSIVD